MLHRCCMRLIVTILLAVGSSEAALGNEGASGDKGRAETNDENSSSQRSNEEEEDSQPFFQTKKPTFEEVRRRLESSEGGPTKLRNPIQLTEEDFDRHKPNGAAPQASSENDLTHWNDKGEVLCEIGCREGYLDEEALRALLASLVTTGSRPTLGRYDAWLTWGAYQTIKSYRNEQGEVVCSVCPTMWMRSQAGSLVSEALKSLQVDDVRDSSTGSHLTGAGMKIGVLSDSFDALGSYALDVETGDLPPFVDVLQDAGGSDEGRAMLQLIYDLVPEAELAFHTAIGGQSAFADGIQKLADAGCDVIVDDILYFAEPMFQDGIVAQSANDVAELRGVSYFASAGNRGFQSWEGDFKPTESLWKVGGLLPTAKPDCLIHDFGDGDLFQTIQTGFFGNFVFQWSDPMLPLGSTRDLDLYVFSADFSSFWIFDDTQLGLDPIDVFSIIGQQVHLMICLNTGGSMENLKMKWVAFSDIGSVEHGTNSSTSYGHNNAENVAGVGAAFFQQTPEFGTDPPQLESFSSRGGTPIYFARNGTRLEAPIVRNQPRFVATDGCINTFFGQFLDFAPNGLGWYFFGTSAAAPNAAAVALMLLQQDPNLNPLEVYGLLQETALEMETPGFDFDTGYGLIDAEAAVALLQSLAEPTPAPTSTCGPKPYGCSGSCDDCNERLLVPGCTCEICECAVCKIDSFCCETQWDRKCAELAEEICQCSTEAPSDIPSQTPSNLPSRWPSSMPSDQPSLALSSTPSQTPSFPTSPSSTPSTSKCQGSCGDGCGFCFLAARTPGCKSCPECEDRVCQVMPECCVSPWGNSCKDKAIEICDCCLEQ